MFSCLLFFADYKSWRHPALGSVYIFTLCEVLQRNACKDHLADMLEVLNAEMARFVVPLGGSQVMHKLGPNSSHINSCPYSEWVLMMIFSTQNVYICSEIHFRLFFICIPALRAPAFFYFNWRSWQNWWVLLKTAKICCLGVHCDYRINPFYLTCFHTPLVFAAGLALLSYS